MTTTLKIDFVSDVSCPWCAIGLFSLEQALKEMGGSVEVDLHFRPFELNPNMPAGGQDIAEHLTQKYGSTPEQQAQIQETIRLRGAEVGFTFRWDGRKRIYNTFDAHRLLHWAGLPSTSPAERHLALKKALLEAYFTHGESPEAHEVLLRVVGQVGLDAERAREILNSDEYVAEVRDLEKQYINAGIHSVPAVIINNAYLISGGQPIAVFRQGLEKVVNGRVNE